MVGAKAFFSGARDLVVLCVILAVVNGLTERGDPGWLKMNPTPWLLPAALIGARYGFVSGLLSGIAVAMLVASANAITGSLQVDDVIRDNAYFFLSIIAVGAAAGETGRIFSLRNAVVQRDNKRLADQNARLHSQLQVVDETRHQLQHQLALYNAPMCAFDEELITLFSHPQEEFGRGLLRTIHRLTGLTSAGIYVVNGSRLDQTAVLHPTPPLVETLRLDETPLAQQALSANALVRVPDATALDTRQPFLAAFPWLDQLGRQSVLLIQDMPLEAFTLQNLARLELILSWASTIAVLRRTFAEAASADHTVPNPDFQVLLGEAIEADRIHSLPSTLLRFDLETDGDSRRVFPHLPKTAVATRIPGRSAVAVLLPFAGETEAAETSRNVNTVLPRARPQHYIVTGDTTPPALWASLQQ